MASLYSSATRQLSSISSGGSCVLKSAFQTISDAEILEGPDHDYDIAENFYGTDFAFTVNSLLRRYRGNLDEIQDAWNKRDPIISRLHQSTKTHLSGVVPDPFKALDIVREEGDLEGNITSLIRRMDKSMAPSRMPTLLRRVVDTEWMEGNDWVWTEDAYTSTSISDEIYRNWRPSSGKASGMRLWIPQGTPVMPSAEGLGEIVIGRGAEFSIFDDSSGRNFGLDRIFDISLDGFEDVQR